MARLKFQRNLIGQAKKKKKAATGSRLGWVARSVVPQRKWSLIILMNSGTLDICPRGLDPSPMAAAAW